MAGTGQWNGSAINWLLEMEDPGVRYLAMRDLLTMPDDDPELVSARREAHEHGRISTILEKMKPEGYWVKPGAGYSPKYTSTVWSLLLWAQLGAQASEDERIAHACAYLLEHALTPGGQFGSNSTPSGTIDCLKGNLVWTLLELGHVDA